MTRNARRAAAILLCVFCALLWLGATGAVSAKDPKDVAVEHISKIRHDNPDFKIKIKPVSKTGKFQIGDEVNFEFTSSRDAYLTIVDIGTSGKVHVIFPNRFHKSNKVKAGEVYRIPAAEWDYVFRVKGPKGVNYVKAIGTLKPFDCFRKEALVESDSPFFEVKDVDKALKDLAVEMTKQDTKGWTEAETKFTIVAGRAEAEEEGEPEKTRHRKPPKFAVKLWTEKKVYNIGDPITFYFYAEKDCYLNLVDFGTSGKVQVVFPNRFQRDNLIKGGEVVAIPTVKEDDFRFRIKGPEGTEVVKAVVTTHKLQLYRGSYDWEKYVYQPWDEKAEKVEKDIEVQLEEMPEAAYVKAKTSFKVKP